MKLQAVSDNKSPLYLKVRIFTPPFFFPNFLKQIRDWNDPLSVLFAKWKERHFSLSFLYHRSKQKNNFEFTS